MSRRCPCGEPLFFAKDKLTRGLFVFCPLCGCAWGSPPPKGVVDSLTPVKVFAPSGVEQPTRAEIEAAGFNEFVEDEVTYTMLPDYLVDYLQGTPPD